MNFPFRKGPLYMAAASVCWSFGGLCIKFVPWGAMSIIGLRAAFAAVVFAIYRRSVKVELTPGNVASALFLSVTTILFVFANKLTTAAAAILLQFTAPAFIILIELVVDRKKPRPGEIAAVAAVVFGIFLLFAGRLESGGFLGNLFGLASGFTFAGVFFCNRRPDVDTKQSLFLGFLINAALGLPFALSSVSADPVPWLAVAFMGLVQVGLAYVFFSIGIRSTPALLACLISALEPLLNPIWVALAADEVPGPSALLGGLVIVSSVVIYNVRMEKRPGDP